MKIFFIQKQGKTTSYSTMLAGFQVQCVPSAFVVGRGVADDGGKAGFYSFHDYLLS